ncbi:hypothetical protein BHE74_00052007 [Ensete ventricosum]|nr:hypothetical protein BHE74_00052007 [Ensete ventricosum]RZS21336.1 hypothetical protein BHM03_00053965 [Ensete ventricosum]
MAQGSSPEEDRDTPEDCRGSRKACRSWKDVDLGSSLGIEPRFGRCREFARTLPKVSGRSLGTRQEIVEG